MLGRNALAIFLGLFMACAVFLPAAHADEWNQKTKLTFNHPVEIPGRVLPAGSYWFVLARGMDNRNVVEIFNGSLSKEYATEIAIPTIRHKTTDRTEVIFAERPSNKPEAMLSWYYPGRRAGHEFLYQTRHKQEFARDQKQVAFAGRLQSRS